MPKKTEDISDCLFVTCYKTVPMVIAISSYKFWHKDAAYFAIWESDYFNGYSTMPATSMFHNLGSESAIANFL